MRHWRFPGPLAEIMHEFLAETVPLEIEDSLSILCLPAAGIVSQIRA